MSGITEKNQVLPVHTPVMLNETLSYLSPQPGGCYVDMTIGYGGHASAILSRLDTGCLVGIDRDAAILELAEPRLQATGKQYHLRCSPFADIEQVLGQLNISAVDGVLFDLGVSSYQLDDAHRGFSFSREGPLDMRMGADAPTTAESILRQYSEEALANLIWQYGEEPRSRRIAKAIVRTRQFHPIRTTLELANIVAQASGYSHGRIHPATRVFQALRIAVNDELEQLSQGLATVLDCVKLSGRIVVISFHSLEDRIVKNFFRSHKQILNILTPKPIMATPEEQHVNPRSRSAKLRCAQKQEPEPEQLL